MPKIKFAQRFMMAYAKLDSEGRKRVDKALRLLAENPRHPSLRTKPVRGTPGVYEARIDRATRMTYERLPGDTLLIRVVGGHDKALKRP